MFVFILAYFSVGSDASSELEELLIENGAKLFERDCRGRLPLHYAFVKIGYHKDTTHNDPIELVTTLTRAMDGKMLDEADNFGQTALHRAALRGAGVSCLHLIQVNKLLATSQISYLGSSF